MKKEELIAENAKLKNEVNNKDGRLTQLRQDMCSVLGYKKSINSYGIQETEITDLSWPEIHAEIGRLREIARQKDQHEQLRYFEEMINRHELQLNETTHEK
jgi:hypothetical protein